MIRNGGCIQSSRSMNRWMCVGTVRRNIRGWWWWWWPFQQVIITIVRVGRCIHLHSDDGRSPPPPPNATFRFDQCIYIVFIKVGPHSKTSLTFHVKNDHGCMNTTYGTTTVTIWRYDHFFVSGWTTHASFRPKSSSIRPSTFGRSSPKLTLAYLQSSIT